MLLVIQHSRLCKLWVVYPCSTGTSMDDMPQLQTWGILHISCLNWSWVTTNVCHNPCACIVEDLSSQYWGCVAEHVYHTFWIWSLVMHPKTKKQTNKQKKKKQAFKRTFLSITESALLTTKIWSNGRTSVTAQFYLASKGKYILEAWGRADPKDKKRREAPWSILAPLFVCFFSFPWACPV